MLGSVGGDLDVAVAARVEMTAQLGDDILGVRVRHEAHVELPMASLGSMVFEVPGTVNPRDDPGDVAGAFEVHPLEQLDAGVAADECLPA
jgi:hypothetical protein